jgi:hypothetical protein
MIQALSGVLHLFGGDFLQVCTLGEVVTQQAIGVFIEPPLPRVMWLCKVHAGLQCFGKRQVICEL